jgi:hypothetical protein
MRFALVLFRVECNFGTGEINEYGIIEIQPNRIVFKSTILEQGYNF